MHVLVDSGSLCVLFLRWAAGAAQVGVAILKFLRQWVVKLGAEVAPHVPALQKLFLADVIPGDCSEVVKKEVFAALLVLENLRLDLSAFRDALSPAASVRLLLEELHKGSSKVGPGVRGLVFLMLGVLAERHPEQFAPSAPSASASSSSASASSSASGAGGRSLAEEYAHTCMYTLQKELGAGSAGALKTQLVVGILNGLRHFLVPFPLVRMLVPVCSRAHRCVLLALFS